MKISRTVQMVLQFVNAKVFRNKQKVLGRAACLGNDLFALRYPRKYGFRLINQQKVRLDLWLCQQSGTARPKPEMVKNHMSRQDVFPLIENQAALPWLEKQDVGFLLMDSFSELTDQKFTHRKEGWSFCCHYADLNHTAAFDNEFESCGLLPLEEIETVYTQFFAWFEKEYPGKQVVFIHFPTALDERVLYKARGAEILRVMTQLEAAKPYIRNLAIDETLVDWHENDRFPYHYSKSTNAAFIALWDKLDQ